MDNKISRVNREDSQSSGSYTKHVIGQATEPIRRVLSPLFKLLIIAAMVAVVFVIVHSAEQWLGLGIAEAAQTKASTSFQQTILPALTKVGLDKVYSLFFKPENIVANYGFESEVQQNEDNKDLGVRITEFEQKGGVLENQPVELYGVIQGLTTQEQTEVILYCSLDKKSGTLEPDTIIPAQAYGSIVSANKFRLLKNVIDTFQAKCVFPSGLSGDTPIISAQAKLYALYDFETVASYRVYKISKSDLMVLKQKQKSPFEQYPINDPYLSSDGKVTSRCTNGPINLGIGVYLPAPFTENNEYPFAVSLKPNILFGNGNMKKLNKLELKIPQSIVLEGDQEYGTKSLLSEGCDFVYTGAMDENNLKVYTLKQNIINNINEKCSDQNLKYAQLTKKDCIDLYWNNLDFRCKFKIIALEPGEGITADSIGAIVDYTFQTEMPASVIVRKEPQKAESLKTAMTNMETYLK